MNELTVHMPFRFGALTWALVGPTYGAQCFAHRPMHLVSKVLLQRIAVADGFGDFNLGLLWADIEGVPHSFDRHALPSVAWGPFLAQRSQDRWNACLNAMSPAEVEAAWDRRPADHHQLSRLPDPLVRALAHTAPDRVAGIVSTWSSREDIGAHEQERAALGRTFETLRQLAAVSLTTRRPMFVLSIVP